MRKERPMGKRGPHPKHSDQDYVDAIISYRKRHGYSPTFRDLATELGITSSGYHSARIRKLHEAGIVRSDPGHARSIVVVQDRV